jgi:hypothetical protein
MQISDFIVKVIDVLYKYDTFEERKKAINNISDKVKLVFTNEAEEYFNLFLKTEGAELQPAMNNITGRTALLYIGKDKLYVPIFFFEKPDDNSDDLTNLLMDFLFN